MLVSFAGVLPAQNESSLGISGDYGFLFLHSQELAPIGQSYPVAINIDYSRWLLKKKHWDNCRCFPRVGISTGFHYFDNPSVLGVGVPLYGFLQPWYPLSERWFFNLHGGIGFAWLSQPYDSIENPYNLSYSLPLSIFANLGIGSAFAINDQWRLNLQVRYNHTSNGGFREPNKGLNYPSMHLGLDYSWRPLKLKPANVKTFNPAEARRSLRYHLFAAGKAGAKVGEGVNEQDVTYLVYGTELRYSQQFARTSAFTAGLEWVSNGAYAERIERQGLDRDHRQFSLLIGHEFLLGNFVLTQMAGIYLYKDYGEGPDWYQRYGLLWYPLKRWSIGSNIKVHGHVAEFIDLRIGYRYSF